MSHSIVPHLAFPFQFDPSGLARTVEQDTVEEIVQSVEVLVGTEQGERLEVPDYGLAGLLFGTDVDRYMIRAEIERWEPRALTNVLEGIDEYDPAIRRVLIEVSQAEEL